MVYAQLQVRFTGIIISLTVRGKQELDAWLSPNLEKQSDDLICSHTQAALKPSSNLVKCWLKLSQSRAGRVFGAWLELGSQEG